MNKKIAILGSTGHIAKGLIDNLSLDYHLVLFARRLGNFGLFPFGDYDVVINCIGVREKLWTDPFEIFRITEDFDNRGIDYIRKHPDTLYISFSSGAVFGGRYGAPTDERSMATFDVNGMNGSPVSFYGISKLNAEAKHRSLKDANIIDIRVFSYFSRYIHRDEPALMNQIITCIEQGKELATSPEDFYRDYIHPKDLARLVECAIAAHHLNAAFDAYSRRPVGKFEMLDFFRDNYGLRYRIDEDWKETSPTGPKPNYYSNNTGASDIGYAPEYESIKAIKDEAEKILNREGARDTRRANAKN